MTSFTCASAAAVSWNGCDEVVWAGAFVLGWVVVASMRLLDKIPECSGYNRARSEKHPGASRRRGRERPTTVDGHNLSRDEPRAREQEQQRVADILRGSETFLGHAHLELRQRGGRKLVRRQHRPGSNPVHPD